MRAETLFYNAKILNPYEFFLADIVEALYILIAIHSIPIREVFFL